METAGSRRGAFPEAISKMNFRLESSHDGAMTVFTRVWTVFGPLIPSLLHLMSFGDHQLLRTQGPSSPT